MLGLDVDCTDFNADIYDYQRAHDKPLENRNLFLSVIYLTYRYSTLHLVGIQ